MNQPASRTMRKSYYLITFLLLLTPALLMWQHFGMTRIIEISPRQPHGARVTDDSEHDHGNSVSSLVLSDDAIIMRCKLGPAAPYPFCKLQFLLGAAGKGVDLSQFETIVLNMRYSESPPQSIKLHLMNFEPEMSTVGDWNSQRFNEAEIKPAGQPSLAIPVNVLRTADWWRSVRKVPLSRSYARLDNVTAVELSTGYVPPGQQFTIELQSIQIRGKWISQAKLLMYLVSAWIGFGILGLASMQARTAELRQQTRYLRTLIDTLPLWVWLKDTGHRYLAVNQAKAAACGRSVEEMVGKSDQELWPPELAGSYHADDTEVITTRHRATVEQPVASENGLVWMETYRAPVLDDDGTLLGMVGVSRNINERKAAEAAREKALAEAVRLARLRSEFLAQMSHELRTPLNAILGYAQILQRDPHLTKRQTTGLATIHESGQHLLTLINDILDLARVEAGKLSLDPNDVDPSHLLRIVDDIIRVKAEEKNLSFEFRTSPALPAAVTVDDKRLRQVLLNLLGNAVKFTDRGGIVLSVQRVAALESSQSTVRLRFEVEDTGIGMSEEQLSRIFQPFEQVSDIRRREAGTGLGLAISQQLIRLMGGNIHVRSEQGKGSLFWFELDLPLASPLVTELQAPARILAYEGPRRKVLVVDDVPHNRAMLIEALQPLGFDVCDAKNGEECLAVLDDACPDLIVMDVMMPVMDGREATRRIRRMPEFAGIPIIIVTASANREEEAMNLEAGANAFIPKPIELDKLLKTIGTLLSLTWIHDERAQENAEETGDFVAPPQHEIETLYRLAKLGNMKLIMARADYLKQLDQHYIPFASRLRHLADSYQSKAVMALVERYRSNQE
ncbi:response regulator [Duganella sp. FT92W]|uniref:Virulence sensor protein BvgS n=1 Tax=Pseudoduganella rivuli TaxID=2666085 RepID=A0A7X2LU88_9BURK|nr:ATP-binding protein [Pseudoduganella rivuli]MRV72782.1 response regulator [Pseudoduganella rivuli]